MRLLVWSVVCLIAIRVAAAERLAPNTWTAKERERYQLLSLIYDFPKPLATGAHGMIGGTSGPLAVHTGLRVLQQNGSAADACIATALAQVVLTAGSWNSFAGVLYMVYYDTATGTVSALNAGYNTVLGEMDPFTIPARPTPSGRTALVPGFMAGIEVAHRRFGRLPLPALFEPAINLAADGIVVDSVLAGMIAYRKDVLTRLPEARAIFTRPDGKLYAKGDVLCQPQLAQTLRQVAGQGAAHMYAGDWGRRFVRAVQAEGGKMTIEDLQRYRAEWTGSLRATYGGREVCTLGLPELGAVQLIEALQVLQCAELTPLGHYTKSPEALYWLIQICRLGPLISYYRAGSGAAGTEGPFGLHERVQPEWAKAHWERLQRAGWQQELYRALVPEAGHSDGIVAVDARGNVAAVLHTINTTAWGTTGLFVDGVSIPDSASFQQRRVAQVGPGVRFPNIANPVIVLEGGRPMLAASCIGAGLDRCMLLNLVNTLTFGMDPKTAVETPGLLGPALLAEARPDLSSDYYTEAVPQGVFGATLLNAVRKRGQPIGELTAPEQTGRDGFWVGIQIDPATGKLRGGVAGKLNGLVEGY